MPLGRGAFPGMLVEVVFAAEILHALGVHLEELRGGGLLAAGAAQGRVQISDFNFFHFGIKVYALFGNQNGFLAAGAVMKQVLRQVLRSDDVAGNHHDEALDDIFEFSDVAGPGVVLENFENFGLQGLDGLFGGGTVDAEEVVDKKRKISVTLAQWRDDDRHDVDAEVEVFAEAALADGILKVFVGSGNQAEIDFASDSTAEPLHGALLENAQKFALKIGIEGRDFVEKKRAIVRGFDHAGLGGIGSGERALFVAEEFGLHQGFGESGAVEADEGMIRAVAALDDGLGDEFLAYSAFAAQND